MVRVPDDIDFALSSLPRVPRPRRVLLTTPQHFDVLYVINPHMEGHVGAVNFRRAQAQWNTVRDAYESLDLEVHIIPGAEGQPDMVFCANQTLPVYHAAAAGDPAGAAGAARSGAKREYTVLLSRMFAPERRDEVAHYDRFFSDHGYEIAHLPESVSEFEGMGDALWHPGRALLWGGFGFRTDWRAYAYVEKAFGVPVVALELSDPDFYHLDTCLSVLDEQSCLIYPGAFSDAGLGCIHRLFSLVLEAPEHEARRLFAVNAHCPDGRHVIIQQGCEVTCTILSDAGYEPIEVPTDEFLKAGGSVFCMKQMFW